MSPLECLSIARILGAGCGIIQPVKKMASMPVRAPPQGEMPDLYGVIRPDKDSHELQLHLDPSLLSKSSQRELIITIIHEALTQAYPDNEDRENEKIAQRLYESYPLLSLKLGSNEALLRYSRLTDAGKKQAVEDFVYESVLMMRLKGVSNYRAWLRQEVLSGKKDIIALLKDNKVCAFIMYTLHSGRLIEVDYIRTKDNLRKRGIGTLVWDALLLTLDAELDIKKERAIYHSIKIKSGAMLSFWNKLARRLSREFQR